MVPRLRTILRSNMLEILRNSGSSIRAIRVPIYFLYQDMVYRIGL